MHPGMDAESRGPAPPHAPEPPPAVTLAPLGDARPRHRRASRFLVVPSGWVLFVCLLLPSVRFCEGGSAVPCAVIPPAWPPFVAGLMIGFAALEGPRRAAASARQLGLFTYIVVLGYAALFALALSDRAITWDVAVPAAGVSLVVWLIARWCRRAQSELAVAVLSWLLSLGAALCGLALGLVRDATWGGQVIAVAACALAAGTSCWLVEAAFTRISRRRA
jgi:hypothetical protein